MSVLFDSRKLSPVALILAKTTAAGPLSTPPWINPIQATPLLYLPQCFLLESPRPLLATLQPLILDHIYAIHTPVLESSRGASPDRCGVAANLAERGRRRGQFHFWEITRPA
jgi:hypothetical protein